jgi:hypothetical protein
VEEDTPTPRMHPPSERARWVLEAAPPHACRRTPTNTNTHIHKPVRRPRLHLFPCCVVCCEAHCAEAAIAKHLVQRVACANLPLLLADALKRRTRLAFNKIEARLVG